MHRARIPQNAGGLATSLHLHYKTSKTNDCVIRRAILTLLSDLEILRDSFTHLSREATSSTAAFLVRFHASGRYISD